jgi:hypothetical protein
VANSIEGHVLDEIAGQPRGGALRVAEDADPVAPVDQGTHVATASRRDDRDPIAGIAERAGLEPHASIERDRQVLVEDDHVRAA